MNRTMLTLALFFAFCLNPARAVAAEQEIPSCVNASGAPAPCIVMARAAQEATHLFPNAKREQLLKLLMIMHGVARQNGQ